MKKKIKVDLLNGLHARPATQISIAASKCSEDVILKAKGQRINAKSIVSVLALCLLPGEELEIESDNEWIFNEIGKILSSQENEQIKTEVIQKEPRDLNKFIEKSKKKAKNKIYFSSKSFSDTIADSIEQGQLIDSTKIFKVGEKWCIDGAVPELIHALGVDKNNKLEIISGM
jgi:phosphocarrier protein